MSEILIYCVVGLGCFAFGFFASFRGYKKKVLEILDYLRWSKKLDIEEYTHYKNRFIEKQDTLKNIRNTVKSIRKEEKENA